ncbi:MAG: tRNA (adenosine(37)-N6)-dimethylallyltransferase MiaA [Bdellovibrionota bacterium]
MNKSDTTINYLTIVGPTGSGKSSLAKKIAAKIDGEIISCDSVQIYKGFNIGSAKDSIKERKGIPHHLIDIAHWSEDFDASQYASLARKAIEQICNRGKIAIVVGGTGLYLRALLGDNFHTLPTDPLIRSQIQELSNSDILKKLEKTDPQRAREIHPNDRVRLVRALELATVLQKPLAQAINLSQDTFYTKPKIQLFINPERSYLHKRIAARTTDMLQKGLIDEVKELLKEGCPQNVKPMQSIGYAQVIHMLNGKIAKENLEEKIIFATRQYAKRQCTWFKKINDKCTLYTEELNDSIIKKIFRQIAY